MFYLFIVICFIYLLLYVLFIYCYMFYLFIVICIEAAEYCSQLGAIFTETSALTAIGVNELFTNISEFIFIQHDLK